MIATYNENAYREVPWCKRGVNFVRFACEQHEQLEQLKRR
jgi:hypothetical protein